RVPAAEPAAAAPEPGAAAAPAAAPGGTADPRTGPAAEPDADSAPVRSVHETASRMGAFARGTRSGRAAVQGAPESGGAPETTGPRERGSDGDDQDKGIAQS
ncbi:hypothetical protein LZ495_43310, partial [Yinghuangia sp. KLBMP8922]|nr:hypothetical protein [Yinghuangia soli]